MTNQPRSLAVKPSATVDVTGSRICVEESTTSPLKPTKARLRACGCNSPEQRPRIFGRILSSNGKTDPAPDHTRPAWFQPQIYIIVRRPTNRCSTKRTQRLRRKTIDRKSVESGK